LSFFADDNRFSGLTELLVDAAKLTMR